VVGGCVGPAVVLLLYLGDGSVVVSRQALELLVVLIRRDGPGVTLVLFEPGSGRGLALFVVLGFFRQRCCFGVPGRLPVKIAKGGGRLLLGKPLQRLSSLTGPSFMAALSSEFALNTLALLQQSVDNGAGPAACSISYPIAWLLWSRRLRFNVLSWCRRCCDAPP
jgi:hypothetical protein